MLAASHFKDNTHFVGVEKIMFYIVVIYFCIGINTRINRLFTNTEYFSKRLGDSCWLYAIVNI